MREFWTRDGSVPGSTWACGWDTPSPEGSSSGASFSPRSVGHLGFTGTSVWIDLEQDVHVILLSNRVHPRRDNRKIGAVRPALHDAVMQSLFPAERLGAVPVAADFYPAPQVAAEPVALAS